MTPEDLDGFERLGLRFGWRTSLIATGEPVTDDTLRTLIKRRLLLGGKRTWVTEHFVEWPEVQLEGPRGVALQQLRQLYESQEWLRRAFAAADGERMREQWMMQAEDGHDASGERPDEVHIANGSSDAKRLE